MRDLARLSALSPHSPIPASPSSQPSGPSAPHEDYWCEDCRDLATDACNQHQLLLLPEWVETQKATLESLEMAVEDQLTQHSAYIEELRVTMKGVYYALNKATRSVWEMNKKVEEYREELRNQQTPISARASQSDTIYELKGKMAQLERLAQKVSKEDVLEGDGEVMLTFKQQQQQILIRTTDPNYALILTIADGHAAV